MKTIFPPRFPSGHPSPVSRVAVLVAGLLAGLALTAPPEARAQVTGRLQNLARFNGDTAGALPNGPLVQGSDGNFYGTATFGGASHHGTLFKATPAGEITTLYSFGGGSDGQTPVGGLTLGSDGNFYGTTSGYTGLPRGPYEGTIFRCTPGGVLTTLHRFSGTSASPLVQGKDGNFYGIVPAGSAPTDASDATSPGVVFQITSTGDFTVIHRFADGSQSPAGKLALGKDGNFYGVTRGTSVGTVFQITPGGVFTSFGIVPGYSGGANPNGGLVQAPDGNFYGTTEGGRETVFRVDSGGGLGLVHVFYGDDGATLQAGLTLAPPTRRAGRGAATATSPA